MVVDYEQIGYTIGRWIPVGVAFLIGYSFYRKKSNKEKVVCEEGGIDAQEREFREVNK